MGFWGTLGKIGAGIAAPFTGGASLAAIPAIDAIGGALGGGAAAAKAGRMDEAQLQALINAQNNRAQVDAAGFNAGREGQLIRRALSARMLGDMGQQGPRDPRDRFGGGEVSPVLQQLLARYGDMADKDVMSGGYKVTPTMSGIPKSGLLEKIGGAAGLGGGILGALSKIGGSGRPNVQQVGGGMGGSTGAPNLPYQPLPHVEPWLASRPFMASLDPRLQGRG